jgi:hypothetical protein
MSEFISILERIRPGYKVGGIVTTPKRGLVDEPGSYAGYTKAELEAVMPELDKISQIINGKNYKQATRQQQSLVRKYHGISPTSPTDRNKPKTNLDEIKPLKFYRDQGYVTGEELRKELGYTKQSWKSARNEAKAAKGKTVGIKKYFPALNVRGKVQGMKDLKELYKVSDGPIKNLSQEAEVIYFKENVKGPKAESAKIVNDLAIKIHKEAMTAGKPKDYRVIAAEVKTTLGENFPKDLKGTDKSHELNVRRAIRLSGEKPFTDPEVKAKNLLERGIRQSVIKLSDPNNKANVDMLKVQEIFKTKINPTLEYVAKAIKGVDPNKYTRLTTKDKRAASNAVANYRAFLMVPERTQDGTILRPGLDPSPKNRKAIIASITDNSDKFGAWKRTRVRLNAIKKMERDLGLGIKEGMPSISAMRKKLSGFLQDKFPRVKQAFKDPFGKKTTSAYHMHEPGGLMSADRGVSYAAEPFQVVRSDINTKMIHLDNARYHTLETLVDPESTDIEKKNAMQEYNAKSDNYEQQFLKERNPKDPGPKLLFAKFGEYGVSPDKADPNFNKYPDKVKKNMVNVFNKNKFTMIVPGKRYTETLTKPEDIEKTKQTILDTIAKSKQTGVKPQALFFEGIQDDYMKSKPAIRAAASKIPGSSIALAPADFALMMASGAPVAESLASAGSYLLKDPYIGRAVNIPLSLAEMARNPEESMAKSKERFQKGEEFLRQYTPEGIQAALDFDAAQKIKDYFTNKRDGGIVAIKGVI